MASLCNRCGFTSCGCSSMNNGHRNYQSPIVALDEKNAYNVILTEIFKTSGAAGCTTSSKSREVILNLDTFIAQSLPVEYINYSVGPKTSISSSNFSSLSIGDSVESINYDSNKGIASGARWFFTGVNDIGKAGGINADGFLYDAFGNQFNIIGHKSVLAYGANTGATGLENTTAIQLALNSAGNVVIPGPDSFVLADSVWIRSSHTQLRGLGGEVVLDRTGDVLETPIVGIQGLPVSFVNSVRRSSILDIKLLGNSTQTGLYLNSANYNSAYRVYIQNTKIGLHCQNTDIGGGLTASCWNNEFHTLTIDGATNNDDGVGVWFDENANANKMIGGEVKRTDLFVRLGNDAIVDPLVAPSGSYFTNVSFETLTATDATLNARGKKRAFNLNARGVTFSGCRYEDPDWPDWYVNEHADNISFGNMTRNPSSHIEYHPNFSGSVVDHSLQDFKKNLPTIHVRNLEDPFYRAYPGDFQDNPLILSPSIEFITKGTLNFKKDLTNTDAEISIEPRDNGTVYKALLATPGIANRVQTISSVGGVLDVDPKEGWDVEVTLTENITTLNFSITEMLAGGTLRFFFRQGFGNSFTVDFSSNNIFKLQGNAFQVTLNPGGARRDTISFELVGGEMIEIGRTLDVF